MSIDGLSALTATPARAEAGLCARKAAASGITKVECLWFMNDHGQRGGVGAAPERAQEKYLVYPWFSGESPTLGE